METSLLSVDGPLSLNINPPGATPATRREKVKCTPEYYLQSFYLVANIVVITAALYFIPKLVAAGISHVKQKRQQRSA